MKDQPAPRFLVVEGNAPEARAALKAAGAHVSGDLYSATLKKLSPACSIDVVRPTDAAENLPAATAIADYDGVAWTGSALNIYNLTPEVTRQIDLARAVYKSGVPFFGSCWALQVAVVAAGGVVHANPREREFGVARKIALTDAGKGHDLFQGKGPVFDAIAIHMDEVATLPEDSRVLASNTLSYVQAAEIRHDGGHFMGVQYHPEYDLREIGRICKRYGEALVKPGFFADLAALNAYAEMTETLCANPDRRDLRFLLGVDDDVLNPSIRLKEVQNWIERVVMPRMSS